MVDPGEGGGVYLRVDYFFSIPYLLLIIPSLSQGAGFEEK